MSLWYGALTTDGDHPFRDRALVSGHGCWVVDVRGREYLDARSALWHATLGYDNQPVIDAITRQLHRLPVSQIIRHHQPPQVDLDYADRLVSVLPANLTHVRFCTTGAQAVEGAVLLSRFVNHRTDVIALWDGYHGIGGLATSLTGERPLHDIQGPPTGVHHVPPGDLDALRDMVERVGPDRITAVLMEPILGTGFVELGKSYLDSVSELCRRHGIHLIVDEVTTGFGRSGSLTVTDTLGVRADMVVLSKGITAGYVPLAAIAVTAEVADAAMSAGAVFPHGSTCDGHPLAMAAADAVLTELTDGGILARVIPMGARLTDALRARIGGYAAVARIHGPGMMVAVSLVDAEGAQLSAQAMTSVKDACLDAGLLISLCGNMVMLTPPLVLGEDEADQIADRLHDGIRSVVPLEALART
jgi:adenosylmethionine-8-amino-7-oxononanoate aminotransferase